MTTVPSRPVAVIGGVDTHADIHVAAACDPLGGILGTESFPTTPAGYRRLLAFLVSFGPVEVVGVEGTGSYGSGLARHLAESGVAVIEVNRPNRQVRRRHGKSDIVDAIAAARAVISGQATVIPKTHDGSVEALRALQIVHRSAMKSRTQALNQLHALVVTAPEPIRGQLRGLRRRQLLATCQSYRPGTGDDLITVTKFALRRLAIRILELTAETTEITKRRRRLLTQTAPELMAIIGVGPDTATTLLITAGDNPGRLGHEKSFAALVGASPIPVNSGQTQGRVRLNRGGDRDANSALWRIAIVRLATDQETRDYVAKRQSEGKTKSEAIRCLKRYIAREVFNALPKQSIA